MLKAQRFLNSPRASILDRMGVHEKRSSYELYLNSITAKPELLSVFEKVDARFITSYTFSAKSLIYLYELLTSGDFFTVLECGSGASSVAIEKSLSMCGRRPGDRLALSLESDCRWIETSRAMLNEVLTARHVRLLYAPIEQVNTPWGQFRTYRSEDISCGLEGRKIDFLLIDGPGPDVGRIGVVPLLKPHLATNALICLDDSGRDTEKQCIQNWVGRKLVRFQGYLPIGKGLALMRNF